MRKRTEAGIQNSEFRRDAALPSVLRLMRSQGGVALLMVLWVLVMLSMVALNYLKSSRWYSASTHNLKAETLSYYMALSGYHEAVKYLLSDKDPSFDFYDAEGNFWVDKETTPVTGKKAVGDGEVEIKIIDEDSKVNINYASDQRLRTLFAYAGIPEDDINTVIDSILDWKDSGDNDAHRLSGAESDYYEGLENPYKAKNGLFDIPEELALVKGVKPEYLYGSDEAKQPLLALITTFGTGTMNINTVSKEIMELMGLDPVEIEAVLKQRGGDTGGFRVVLQTFADKGLNAVASMNLRIEVTAKAGGAGPAARITSVLSRQPGMKGFKMQTLYWRESAENTRS